MFGRHYFGGRYFGPRYWGDGGVPPVVDDSLQTRGGFYPEEVRKRLQPKRIDHAPKVDRVELREMLEEAFEGKRPEPIREVIAEHKLEKGEPKQAFNVDWESLLDDTGAVLKVLRAHEARLEQQRHREAQAAAVQQMVDAIVAQRAYEERRAKLRKIAARLVIEED